MSEDYAGRQAVGVDLHRRRSVINHVRQTRTVDDGSLQSLQESRRRPAAPRRAGRFGAGVLQLRDICQT